MYRFLILVLFVLVPCLRAPCQTSAGIRKRIQVGQLEKRCKNVSLFYPHHFSKFFRNYAKKSGI
jgi:hypothetical protein